MSNPSPNDGATALADVQPSVPSELDSMFDTLLQTIRTWLLPSLLIEVALILGPLQQPTSAGDDPPSIEEAIDAWLLTRAWVNELHVPPVDRLQTGESGPFLEGASVVLRFRGHIIGVGEDYDSGEDALRQAVAQAVRDARQSNRVRDLPFEMIESVGRETTIELELAGKPTPLLGNTLEETSATIRPGVDGLAIRRGERWRWSFPGRMQAFGLADRPDRVLVRLLRELGLPPKEPAELRRIDDVEFYRFDVVILAQETAQATPFESIRGARPIPRTTNIRALAEELASGCAASLLARLASDPRTNVGEVPGAERLVALGLFGDYDLSTDTFKPLVAPPSDQALAAWALARYAGEVPGLDDPERVEARRLAQLILERLELVDPVETEPLSDARTIPLIVLAGLALYGPNEAANPSVEAPPIVARAQEELLRQIQRTAGARDGENAELATNSSLVALEALAASELARDRPDLIPAQTVSRLLEAAWRSQPVDRLVGSLHFLLLAERAIGANAYSDSHRAASQHLIEASIANQIGHTDSLTAPEDPVGDLAGGFVLSGSPRATATASSLRPALAIVIALRNGWVPPPQREAAWQEALELALRFARQLQVDAVHAHRTPAPKRAKGGLKSTPWSNQSRTSDSALALLLATEVLSSAPADAPGSKPGPSTPSGPRTGSKVP